MFDSNLGQNNGNLDCDCRGFSPSLQENAEQEENLMEMIRRKTAAQLTSDFNAGTEKEKRIFKRMSTQNSMGLSCFMME
jgi:hypothetical protein